MCSTLKYVSNYAWLTDAVLRDRLDAVRAQADRCHVERRQPRCAQHVQQADLVDILRRREVERAEREQVGACSHASTDARGATKREPPPA